VKNKRLNKLKHRLTNRVTLIAIFSNLMLLVGGLYFMITGEELSKEFVANLTAYIGLPILTLLTILGIVNDPMTDHKGLSDDEFVEEKKENEDK
jgi:phi LC3 family holin